MKHLKLLAAGVIAALLTTGTQISIHKTLAVDFIDAPVKSDIDLTYKNIFGDSADEDSVVVDLSTTYPEPVTKCYKFTITEESYVLIVSTGRSTWNASGMKLEFFKDAAMSQSFGVIESRFSTGGNLSYRMPAGTYYFKATYTGNSSSTTGKETNEKIGILLKALPVSKANVLTVTPASDNSKVTISYNSYLLGGISGFSAKMKDMRAWQGNAGDSSWCNAIPPEEFYNAGGKIADKEDNSGMLSLEMPYADSYTVVLKHSFVNVGSSDFSSETYLHVTATGIVTEEHSLTGSTSPVSKPTEVPATTKKPTTGSSPSASTVITNNPPSVSNLTSNKKTKTGKLMITAAKKGSKYIKGKKPKKSIVFLKIGSKVYSKYSTGTNFKIKTKKLKKGLKIKAWFVMNNGIQGTKISYTIK